MMNGDNIIYINEKGISLNKLAQEDDNRFTDLLCEEMKLLKNEEIRKSYLESLKDNTLFYVLSNKNTDKFIGYISVTMHEDDYPEIGIYLSPECRGRGISVEFIPKVMKDYSMNDKVSSFIYRAKEYNVASQKVAKSLGAVKIRDEGYPLHKRLIALSEKYGCDFRELFVNTFGKDYDVEKENVIRYRIDVIENS